MNAYQQAVAQIVDVVFRAKPEVEMKPAEAYAFANGVLACAHSDISVPDKEAYLEDKFVNLVEEAREQWCEKVLPKPTWKNTVTIHQNESQYGKFQGMRTTALRMLHIRKGIAYTIWSVFEYIRQFGI